MKGEIIYYVYSTGDGLSGCYGTFYYSEALKVAKCIKDLGRNCVIRTFKCTDEQFFVADRQLSIFDEVNDVS